MKKLLLSLLALAVFAVGATARTLTVTVTNGNFTPQNLTVSVGDKVEWVFAEGEHTTTSGANCTPDGKWDSDTMTEGMKYDYTFMTEGNYPYFCTPHCAMGMVGSVAVTAATGVNDEIISTNITSLKNYPNPFVNATTIAFNAEKTGKAQLQIIAADGRIRQAETIYVTKGANTLPLELDLPTGIYVVRLQLDAVLTETRIVAGRK